MPKASNSSPSKLPSFDTHDHYSHEKDDSAILDHIEEITTHADQVQQQVLTEILTRNADVEYLQQHGLNGCTDKKTFKKTIPIVSYENLKSYLDRIANGDTSPILCSEPISEFLTSSGTSGGERKLMPTTEEELKRRSFLYSLLMPVMNQFVPGLNKGKGMYFLFVKSESSTPGGLPARPVLTSYYKSSHFKDRPYNLYNDYTSLNETILCTDSFQSMYSQFLCGLCLRKQVLRVGAVFASGFIRAIKFLESHWTLLANDIRTGTVNPRITDPLVRQSVMDILKPDPVLADLIEFECSKEEWGGIIARLWPNTKYVDVIVTGTMSQYIPTLDYYSNGLPLVCSMYASSECYFGINLCPLCKPSEVSYTLIPSMAYFEFMPLDKTNGLFQTLSTTHESEASEKMNDRELVDLVDVELGKEYELVITTYSGLYRYAVGDILRVSGFKNNAPQFNFVCRKNVILSIDSDKVDEVELQNAVVEASKSLIPYNTCLLEYTSYADTHTIPGHYVIYWEISLKETSNIPRLVFENCCLTMEESFNSVYRQGRVSDKSIGPLELKIVENGTFDKVMDYTINHGASISQYKTPRCVKHVPVLDILNSYVVSNYFSPKCPNWVPGRKEWSTNG